jgi:hypothetical protein
MARAMKDLTDWRLPYSARIVSEACENNRLVVEMKVKVRWWHPRTWWMALRMVVEGDE